MRIRCNVPVRKQPKRKGPAQGDRAKGPATQRRTDYGRATAFNNPFAALTPPTEEQIARQIEAQPRETRIRTANFAAILANDPLDVVAARVTSQAGRRK